MNAPFDKAVEIAASICRPFEGLRLKPYICPAGYPTIGYGTVFKPDGSRVTMQHPPITKEIAEEWLIHTLKTEYVHGVLLASPMLLAYPGTLGALGDFAYNLGVPRYRASTLRKRIEARDWEGAKAELMKWTKGGGKVLPGLVKRRRVECDFIGT